MLSDPKIAADHEPAARPKVMRRPAHFSQRATVDPVAEIPTTPPAATPPVIRLPVIANHAPARLAWQEDGKFGFWLIVLIALANLALAVGLPGERAPLPAASRPLADAMRPASARPAPLPGRITIYSEPTTLHGDRGF
jgi:hypothetical protein